MALMTAPAAGAGCARRAAFLAGAAALALMPVPLLAQDASGTGESSPSADVYPADEDSGTGNAIIVTATKREATLQDVPVAVTVTTAETIERDQIRDLRDLQSVVPSLVVGQRQSVTNTNFFIRGFGNGANNAGIEPSVGVFVDNVYRSRTAAQITDLPDVERIEVLRGPQSTLFGKNASAGVISISTQEPQFDLGGSAELTYGNYDQVVAKGVVTGPLSDNLAVSLAGGLNQRDGFFRDLGTGDRSNGRDRWFVRGQALVRSPEGLTLRLIGDYDKIDEICCAVVNVRSGAAAAAIEALGGQLNDPDDAYSGVIYNNYNSTNTIENWGFSLQADYPLSDAFDVTSVSAFRGTRAITVQDSDFTSADLIYPNAQDLDVETLTQEVRLTGELADGIDLLLGAFYISEKIRQDNVLQLGPAFRPYTNILVQQASGGALDIPTLEAAFSQADITDYRDTFLVEGTGFDERYTLDSESISLFGQADIEITDGLVLTLGGNYTRDNKTFTANAVSSDAFSAIDFDAPQYAPFRSQLLFQGALAQGVGSALMLGRPATAAEIQGFAAGNTAAFGQVTAGARAYAGANANNPLANPLAPLRALQLLPPFLSVPNAVENGKIDDDNFSYTVRLSYDVSRAVNLYASYATGFKASSVNLSRDSRPLAADRAALASSGLLLNNLRFGSRFAGPEDSRVIEAGIKTYFDVLSLNLTLFDQEIEGFQSNLFTGTGFALLNAGKQSTFGVEVEGTATPVEPLTLTFGLTYLDPVYDSFVVSSVGDLSGLRPAGIPEWTLLLGAQYEFALPGVTIVPRVNYLWQSEEQLIEGLPGFIVRGPDGSIIDAQPALDAAAPFTREVNDLTGSLSFECDCGLTLSLWGRNLLDSRDLGVIFDSPAQPGGVSAYPSDPRTYGATVRYRF